MSNGGNGRATEMVTPDGRTILAAGGGASADSQTGSSAPGGGGGSGGHRLTDLRKVRAYRTDDGRVYHPSQVTLMYDEDVCLPGDAQTPCRNPAHRHGCPGAGWYRPGPDGWRRITDAEAANERHEDMAHFMSDPNTRLRAMAEPRYIPHPQRITDAIERCLDCGALILTEDKPAHTRFHSILSGHAWTLGVLKTSHIGAQVHDKYDTVARIDSKRFDSWSADALAEVTRDLNDSPHEP